MPVQFPAVIQLSDLNGKNGFAINGIHTDDFSGASVSAAGDINADGVADLIVGAPRDFLNDQLPGQSYVLFGGSNVGSTGTIQLSSLNGSNGFVINGAAANDGSGNSVSAAGDINGDGVADLIIGAFVASLNGQYSGQSCVLFGCINVGSSGTVELSSLNGTNGFAINGIAAGDRSGSSVSAAGDINADGVADLVIGAYHASPNGNYSGQSYVLFGGSNVGSTGTIQLSSLNGSNGFTINGISAANYSGRSVSTAGDINGDGTADLLIGAYGADPNGFDSGQSYVLFGGGNVGSSGTVQLFSLNGLNGFAINGIAGAGRSGYSVSAAGDINDDGVADLVIGALGVSQSYVLFGGRRVGSTGTIQVSSLNGSSGFRINGIAPRDQSGHSVSAAGDINADGVVDLVVGAPGASPNGQYSGQSYVLFGSSNVGSGGTVELSSLNGANGFVINGVNGCGFSVSTAGDINADGVADLVIGAPYAQEGAGQSYILFGQNLQNTTTDIILNHNQLTVIQGQTVVLTPSSLQATSNIQPASTLQFYISGIQYGQFVFAENPTVSINVFFQQNITDGQVQFTHDGTTNPPTYTVNAAANIMFVSTPSSAATINFIPCNIALVNNVLTINQAQTFVLDQSNLYATSNPCSQADMQFEVQNVQHGQFEFVQNPSVAITTFSQQNVTEGAIHFVQDGSINAPSYEARAYINLLTTASEDATINFGLALINNNDFTINQGGTVILTSSNLLATNDLDIPNEQIIFQLSDVSYATFTKLSNPATSIMSFSQADIDANQIQFVTDGTPNAPSYSFTVTDGSYTLPKVQNGNITFHYAPTLTESVLTITQGETVLLNNNGINLKAKDPVTPADELIFSILAIKHGCFELVSNPNEIITNFTQGQVDNVQIQFVQDGSPNAPSFNVSVINQFGAISKPQAAIINWTPKSPTTISRENNNLTTRDILIGTFASAGALSAIAVCYISMGYLKTARLNAIAKNKSGDEKDYYQYTIIPIAKEIFDTIKITGFMNYISQEKIKEYVAAIAKVVHEMSELGINIDLQDMPAEQKTLLVNQMIVEMKKALNLTKQGATRCSGFFKPQVTPEQIMEQAKAIATSVREALFSGVSDTRINLPAGMESWQMGGKSKQQAGERTPLLSA